MKLAEPSVVLSLMGVPSANEALTKVGYALDATAPLLEQWIGSMFAAQSRVDYFDFDSAFYSDPYKAVSFRLTSGMVDREEPFTVTVNGVVLVLDTDYSVDRLHGVVRLLAQPVTGYDAVKVEYSHGFPEGGTQKVLQNVPEWLKQAGILAAQRHLQITPAHIAGKLKIDTDKITRTIRMDVSGIINSFIRPRYGLEFPNRTETVE